MNEMDRLYIWEDVQVCAGRITHYMPNQGNHRHFSPEAQKLCYGMFGHLRPFGRAPRCVNLWEANWRKIYFSFSEQYGKAPPTAGFESWWMRSSVDRTGGWDRLMMPGPGVPSCAEAAQGELRPCVVEQVVRLRPGTQDEYLSWFYERVKPAAENAGWRPLVWMKAVHSPLVVTMTAAPDWSGVLDLARAMPVPESRWQAEVKTIALQAWAGSEYLKR